MAVHLTLIVIAVGLLVACPAAAQVASSNLASHPDTVSLTLADVRRLATQQNPALLATRQESAIAAGDLRQARVFGFNPEVTIQSASGFGVSGRPFELNLAQEIEWAGQRGLRIGAARTGVVRAISVVQNAGRLTVAEASILFLRAFAAERRLEVAREAVALHERILQAIRTQLREGEISALEANLAEIEYGRARGRVLAAERAAARERLALKQVIALPPGTALRLGADSAAPSVAAALNEDSLVAVALARRPDLAANTATVRQAETLTSLARREALPNLRFGAIAERSESGRGTQVGPAIGISLPIFNRNQGLLQQRVALAQQARLDRRATELRVRAEVVDAVRAYRTASAEAALIESSVLRPAHANAELLGEAYEAGKIALPSLLLLRNQLLDAELGFWDAWLAQREALVQLESAVGELTPPADALQPLDASDADARAPAPATDRSSR